MPNIKSAKKRVIVNKTKAHTAAETNAADKKEVVTAAIKKVDQAAAKGLIHKNNAARKKSALAKLLNEA